MIIKFENDDIKDLVEHRYRGRYKKLKSATVVIRNLDIAINLIKSAPNTDYLKKIGKLNYEHLKGSNRSSIRIGYSSKYRLEFYEDNENIVLILIELSEHYGEH